MGVSYNPKIITDGLVFCVDAANSRSYPKTGTTWSDLAGSNDGTLTNMDASNFDEANGGSLVFDGTNEYINTLSSVDFSQNGTFGCWFLLDSLGTEQVIGCCTISSSNLWNVQVKHSSGLSTIRAGHYGGPYVNVSSFALSAGVWYNVVMTRVSGSTYLYVNNEIQSGSLEPNSSFTSSNLLLGCRSDIASFLDGKISSVQIYNRGLTADEIRQNYNATKGRYE